MVITFREMEEEDLDRVIELCNICFDEETDLQAAKKVYFANEDDPNQIYIVGEVEGKIVAHLKITVIPTIYGPMGTYAILNHVCVHPDYRREHIGTHLLDYAFKECKKKKCKTVELWSRNFRVPAHELYKKYGFVIDDSKFFIKKID